VGYRNLKQCVEDLERSGQLVRIEDEIDAHLEAAEIHRRVFCSGGPAILFANVKGCRFPMVSNLFGKIERSRFIFRDSLEAVRQLVELKTDPDKLWRHPLRATSLPRTVWTTLPRWVRRGPVLKNITTIDQLPRQQSWPDDGGAFITLPAVYSESVERPGLHGSNLGMYRVQISGGHYRLNEQIGLHYQIHRGIGVHHAAALRQGQPLRVNIFVGGTPAVPFSAVMPLPEGLAELSFAGALARHRIPLVRQQNQLPIYAEADFCITGSIDLNLRLPEGPFGDHLGYYSLAHEFPVFNVKKVYHRDGAIWPFTVVGRSPQEDTVFGQLIHEMTGPAIPAVLPGVHAVHAVDAAGVHPLLLAIGNERYVPYESRQRPQELLTQANAILGQGQLSLAKYLFIVAQDDNPSLRVDDIANFFDHVLKRVDWNRDLHFQTATTIDTLDYSGTGLNEGSKLVVAAVGAPRRELPSSLDSDFRLPDGYDEPGVCLPGILAVRGPTCATDRMAAEDQINSFCTALRKEDKINEFPLIVIVDDSRELTHSLRNFLWITFTRSNPATDVYGIECFVEHKHWGCRGALVIDARSKPHHAPALVEDPDVCRRIDALAARGGPLATYL